MIKKITDISKVIEFFKNSFNDLYTILYTNIALFTSFLVGAYTDIELALLAFLIITSLDTYTSMRADKKINNINKPLWKLIKSSGLRRWCNKVFNDFGISLIIIFVVDILIFKKAITIPLMGRDLQLPIVGMYIFSFIEIWSIGENMEKAGGINIFKKLVDLLPEKIKKLFEK